MPREKETKIPIGERIEDFLHSDSVPSTITKLLLASLALGGVVFVGAVVPNIFRLVESFQSDKGKPIKKYSKKQVSNAIAKLKRKKFIKIIREKNGKIVVKLTNLGKKRIFKMALGSVSIKKPKLWDGKWRIVIFDIPIKYNSAREALRNKMKNLGFKQLQKSVWIIPYECEDEILFISEMFKVEKYVEIIKAENLLHEEVVKKSFKM
ncbi:hypothetical protein BMS3Abin15_00329 [bacterium BMS3Abin15]|nr:hypothetical protein BMS3Abin15_00329 [bacterium BMS3Abin15]HDH07524.1 hypothetical protein [Candidatus Moranbacteria bacterium]HDZ85535.1 hypothetical protein [Candidatus Moranbacteria bacterium]